MYFKEFVSFGLNPLTLSFAGLTTITLWQMVALYQQARMVWTEQSGKSVSMSWFTFLAFFQVVTLYYGIHAHSFTILFTGLTFLFYVPIALGLWKFKVIKLVDKVTAGVSLFGVALLFTAIPPEITYSGFLMASVVPLVGQVTELFKEKSPGNLNPQVLLVLFVKITLWLVFAWSADEIVYKIFAPIYWVMVTATLCLWRYYYLKERPTAVIEPVS